MTSGPALDVTVVTDTAGFAALKGEWDDLHRDAPEALPHESWAFLFSWWQAHDEPCALRLITLRERRTGLLVGLMPLMLLRRRGLRTLVFLVDNEPLDLLARDGWGPAVEAAAGPALRALPGWSLAELRPVRPGARVSRVVDRWRGPRERAVVARYGYACIEAKAEDELLRALSKNHRKSLRRALHRAAEDGLVPHSVPAGQAGEAAARLVALHRELFAGRGISPSHAAESFERFLVLAAPRLAARGLADIVEWRRDGRTEISQLYLYGPVAVHAYQVGASRYAVHRLQWSSLYVWEGLQIARRRGLGALDLAYGEHEYKLRWNPRLVPHERLRLGRGIAGLAFFTARRLLTRARRVRHTA